MTWNPRLAGAHPGQRAPLRAVAVLMLAGLLASACAQPSRTTPTDASIPVAPAPASQSRVLHVVIRDEPSMLNARLDRNGQGFPLTVSLTYRDEAGVVRPLLVERVPSQDDGTWMINPDGTMVTTYRLRNDLKWQDGQPHTAHDFVFTWQVYMDPQVPITTRLPESLMRDVVARDDQTLEISWKEPYVFANALGMIPGNEMAPLPRHLLEAPFLADKAAFSNHGFWTGDGFVGNGPYKLVRWDRGISFTATANPYFALGKPRIETVEYHFVQDANSTVANFLAGVLDFGEYTAITPEMGVTLRDRWQLDKSGRVHSDLLTGVRILEFQHRDVPGHQKAVTDLRVRRALLHAIDRDALAEELQYGFATAADSTVPRAFPVYSRVDPVLTKYPYDVRRAEQILNEVGFTKGADGVFRDREGTVFDLEVRATSEFNQQPPIIADFWKRIGINASPYVIPRAQINDQAVRTGYPGVSMSDNRGDYVGVQDVTLQQMPSEQNRFTGKNRGNYANAELDGLYNLYTRTIDTARRDDLVVEMQKQFTADVSQGLLFYLPYVAAVRTGLVGFKPPVQGTYVWNLWEWSWAE